MNGQPWLIDGPCARKREDGKYNISRSPQPGYEREGERICYTLWDNTTSPATALHHHFAPSGEVNRAAQIEAVDTLIGIANARDQLAAQGDARLRARTDPPVPQ